MVISTAFVADAWAGHFLMKKIFFTKRFSEVVIDWVFFTFFVLIPILVFCGSLYAGSDVWWSITTFVWVVSVGVFYIAFAISTVYFEVNGALNFVIQNHGIDESSILNVYKQCILLKQMNVYSGKRCVKYLAQTPYWSDDDENDGIDDATPDDIFESTRQERMGLWTRLTQWHFLSRDSPGGLPIFKQLDPPKKLFTIDDILDFRPFVTRNTWGLERMYCRPKNSRYITVVNGHGAITQDQMRSSIACALIALVLWLLILTSLLVWLEFGTFVILVAVALFLVVAYPSIKDTLRLIKIMNQVRIQVPRDDPNKNSAATSQQQIENNPQTLSQSFVQSEMNETPNQAIYLVTEIERVTRVTD
jgi:hypothetical protein